jgi:hypothetical protein
VRSGSTTATVTVSDSQSNTYTQQISQNQTTDGHKLTIAYAPNVKVGSNTVTVTLSASATLQVAIHEYGGIIPSSLVDVSTSTQGSGTTPNSGNVTTSQGAELLFAAAAVGGSPSWTAGSGYTLRQIPVNKLATEDQIASVIGTFAGTFSLSASDNWSAAIVTFKALPAYANVTNTFTTQQNFNGNVAFKGPNPYVDVTRYGVRAVNPNVAPAIPGITANINSGSATPTLSSASTFQNGDGVVIYGAGAPHSMTTPGGPTVTPSIAAAGTGTGIVVNAPAGATTYNYQVVARDKNGGLTAASSVGSTTTGAASLGSQSVGISTLSRSNDVVTVTTSAPHGLSVGAMVYITGTSENNSFGGWFVINTVTDTTHFTYSNAFDTRMGAPASATGGTAFWFKCNHLTWTAVTGAWEYYIYGRTGISLTLIGVSRPQPSTNPNLTFDDFGSPMMDGALLPFYVPSTPPGAATSDPLVTTIVSGAGTTTLTLANSAGTTVSGATILFDNAPNIKTAATAASNGNGTLYFPVTTAASSMYVVNSYLILPSFLAISQTTGLLLNDTIEPSSGTQWYGDRFPQGYSDPSFAFQGGSAITIGRANPGIFVDSGRNFVAFHGLNIGTNNVNALLASFDQVGSLLLDTVNFTSGGAGDYMGTGLLVTGLSNNSTFPIWMRNMLFSGGPNQVNGASATPLWICNNCGTTFIESVYLNRRGIFFRPASAGAIFKINWGREQGGIMPFLTVYNAGGTVGGSFELGSVELDTMAHALVANLGATAGVFASGLSINNTNGPSSDAGTVPATLTGRPFRLAVGGGFNLKGATIDAPGLALDGVFNTAAAGIYGAQIWNAGFALGNTYSLFANSAVPSAPTGTVSAGGSVPVGNHTYRIVPFWQNNAEGLYSPASATITTTAGNQTVNLTWTAVAGNPKGYNVYRDGALTGPSSGVCNPSVTTNSFTDTLGFAACGSSAGTVPAGGPTILNASGIYTPKVTIGSETTSSAPRGSHNALIPAFTVTTSSSARVTLDKAITVTRFQIVLATAPAGCSTQAVVQVTDGTTPVSITFANGTSIYDSGAVTQNYAAGANLDIKVSTAAAGCTTNPANGNVTVQYRMQ